MISDQLRTSQGPLARVWLASHWERKISKSQFLQTNLEKTIDAITTNQQSEPIALRLSGQLLLGVVRIYSRKTRYLLEDCNEALVKIKLAFKKGDVNMPDIHQSVANANTITLQDKLTEFDILLPDLPFNSNNNLTEIDPIFDSIGSMSMSQDITLGDMQSGFGNWPLEGGRFDGGGVEAGRRDNGATADNAFNLQELEDPLNNLKLGDDHDNRSINNNAVDFDFDLNDNIDYGMDDNMFNGDREFDNRDASLDTLKDIGIVEDENMFDLDSAMAEPAVRRRKRLVVDQITEIPQEDLRRYVNDASPLVNTRETNTEPVTKSKNVINLVQPSGESLGSDLESMFTRMSNKRRAPAIMSEAQKQARFDDPFATTTTPAAAPTSAFHFDDDGGDFGDDAVFDAAAAAQYTARMNITDDYDLTMSQSVNLLSAHTNQTLVTLENKLNTQPTVKFGEMAPRSCGKAEAAKLFYDILLLSTKNKVKVKQDRPYGEIQVSAPTALAH